MGKRNAVERYVISSARHESKGRQAKGKQQKKEDVKQSSFCCDLQAKSHDVGKDEKEGKSNKWHKCGFNNDGIRPTQWVSETQWSATLFRLPVTRAEGDKQKGSNKKRGRETVLFLLRLTGEVARRGRSDGIRTHGLLVPNQARYQLRYTSKFSFLAKYSVFLDIAVDSTQARFRTASDALVDTLQTAHCADLLHA